MDALIVGLIGTAAAGYLVWRAYKALVKSSACASGNCAGCGGSCSCGSASPNNDNKRK